MSFLNCSRKRFFGDIGVKIFIHAYQSTPKSTFFAVVKKGQLKHQQLTLENRLIKWIDTRLPDIDKLSDSGIDELLEQALTDTIEDSEEGQQILSEIVGEKKKAKNITGKIPLNPDNRSKAWIKIFVVIFGLVLTGILIGLCKSKVFNKT